MKKTEKIIALCLLLFLLVTVFVPDKVYATEKAANKKQTKTSLNTSSKTKTNKEAASGTQTKTSASDKNKNTAAGTNADSNNANTKDKANTQDNTNTQGEADTRGDTDARNNTKVPDEKNTKPDIINYTPVTLPEDAKAPEVTKPEYEETSYTQDTFFTQRVLKGIYSSSALYFYVPDYWDTKYVYAEIQYDISQLIEQTASSVTFSINNVPLESYRLEYKEGRSQLLYVKIPVSELTKGYNSFTVSAYARLFNDEGCVDDYSDANWFSIKDTSYVRSGYECKDPENRISYYPYPFMSTANQSGEGLTIAVSDQAANGEIAAAMNLMGDLSSYTVDENSIQLCLLSDLYKTSPTRTIVISSYENLPEEYKKLVVKIPDNTGNTTVSFADDAKGNPLLIITSAEAENLSEAVFMLMDENRLMQESSNVASVEKGSALLAVNSAKMSDMIAGKYTLEDIMGSGLSYVGPFHQENFVYLPVSQDFILSDSGKVALKFRYSENLDFTRSLVTVYWGDIPIASKKLSLEKAPGDELNFDMPSDTIGTTAASLKISFDLEIADLICTPRQQNMPWAYISRESTIYLPPSSDITLSFDRKASPFRLGGKFNDVMIITSNQPSTNELNLLGQIIAMYGNGVEPYGNLYVRKAAEFTQEDSDYNIITTGTYSGNSLISQINGNLNFKYGISGTGFESNEQLVLSKEYSGKISILQLLESPFALNRGLLAVTGSNEDSLLKTQEYLRDSVLRSKLIKDCAIIDNDFNMEAFRFISNTNTETEPDLVAKFVRSKKSLIFTAIATSAMFMLLLAVIIILLRIRTYRKKNDRNPS